MEKFQMYIDGEFCDAEGGASFESCDPSTDEAWAIMPAATMGDTDRAVKSAWRAFSEGEWPAMTATQRGKLIMKLAELVVRDAQIMAELETRDTGKIIRETSSTTAYASEYFRYYAGVADKIEGSVFNSDKPTLEVYTRREPLGVVAAVVPWNSQLFLTAVKLGPALAAGNTVVLKASEDGPAPILHFARLAHEAGFPKGVINVITGFGPECGAVLTAHPLVARVAFTGGPETARHVVRNTAENFALTTLELGGKSPVMVFPDANLESATNGIIAGIFGGTGQSCVAGSRLLLHDDVYDDMPGPLAERAPKIKIGPPLDMKTEVGPLATKRQKDNILSIIKDSVDAGATIVTGGNTPGGFNTGNYLEPTIIAAPSPEVRCVAEECFGPVLSVLRFTDEDEAVQLANNTRYGFASGIFTTNLSRAHRIIRKLRCGIVWVNTYRVVSPVVPFGGNKLTGHGREGGMDTVLDYTRTKSVWINTSDEPMADPFVLR
jgi:acyl-CoA reductase-like NAD-dependent aldehyde dehydrogenase